MVNSPKSRNWWPPQPLMHQPISNKPEAQANMYRPGGPMQSNGVTADNGFSQDNEMTEMLGLLNVTSDTQSGISKPQQHMDPTNLANSEGPNRLSTPSQQQHATQPARNNGANRVFSPPAYLIADDNDYEDMPLVSKRLACSSNVAAAAAAAVDNGPPRCLQWTLPASSAVLSPAVSDLPPCRNVGGELWGNGFTGPSVAQAPFFKALPSWAYQASCVLYVAVFLTPESHDVLLSMVPPKHPCISADHMTLAYKPSIQQILGYPLGAEVELRVLGTAADSRVQAVIVDPPIWLPPTNSISTHITISVAVGTRAVEAGHLIADAMQRAAMAGPSGPGPGGTGAYVALEEPLQLVGKLGVMVKAKPVAGIDMGDTVVIYTIEDLDKGGHVSIGAGNLKLFHQQHDTILHRQVQHYRGNPHTVCESPNSNGRSHNSPLSASAVSPLELPPSVVLAASSAPSAAGSTDSRASAILLPSSVSTTQPWQLQLGGPNSEQQTMDAIQDNESDGGSSDSSIDAVQFKSAVHVGDYVALRPFVPATDDEQLLQGYVREYACDDAFQGNGVLVVLTDNTIGFVTTVLDAATAGTNSRLVSRRACSTSTPGGKRDNSKHSKHPDAAAAKSGSTSDLVSSPCDGANTDIVGGWALAAPVVVAASTAGLDVRSAADAQHDLQLWAEFEALQQQHGESLCNAILADCNQDFQDAISMIKAQATTSGTSTTLAASSTSSQQASQQGLDEDLAQQLALSLGMSAGSALQLCKLAPQTSAERVVEVLMQHSGDVSKAADALLFEGGGTIGGSSHVASADIAALDLLGSKDANLVLDALRLCQSFPNLAQDTAEMLLLEHGGNYEQAAECVSDMQISELEARTAAAAALNSNSRTQHSSNQQQGQQHVSEEDQMAMLLALGLLEDGEGHDTLQQPSEQSQHATTVPPPPPPKHQHRNTSPLKSHVPIPASSGGTSSPSPSSMRTGGYNSPPRSGYRRPRPYLPQRREPVVGTAEREAKNAARDVADQLYTKSKSLIAASQVHLTAAQAMLDAGNMEGYRQKKQAADKARMEGRAAFEEANRLSWAANNKTMQSWSTDLHGLGTTVAMRRFVDTLQSLLSMDSPGGVVYHVVTGKGKHSDDNVPKIKLNVLKYLEERANQVLADTGKPWVVTWRIDPSNEGCVQVHIPGSGDSQGP